MHLEKETKKNGKYNFPKKIKKKQLTNKNAN